MFVLQRYLDDLECRHAEWERDCERWLDEKRNGAYYHLYSEEDYARQHPEPGGKIVTAFFLTVAILLVLGLIFGIILLISHAHNNRKAHHPQKAPQTAQSAHNCQDLNLDDHIRIQYGRYAGLTGKVIGGCSHDQNYQIKLDGNQKREISGDGIDGETDLSGQTISVNSSQNLVVIQ